jgi:hypothetical protein
MSGLEIAPITDCGCLGVMHLKRFWSLARASCLGLPRQKRDECADTVLLCGLRAGIHEALSYATLKAGEFEQFEAWILEINGGLLDPARVNRINAALAGTLDAGTPPATGSAEAVLGAEDLEKWDRDGYVVVHDAATPDQCRAASEAIYEFMGVNPADPQTWYGNPRGHSIWVPLLRHPAFRATRESPRIHAAFAQLWGRTDLWASIDQGGFNPPERPKWPFPGPNLHWDVSIAQPIPLNLSGLLYLTDTAADQGAFRCVPGFHRRIGKWLEELPLGANPRDERLMETLGAIPIPGRAGDLIIWSQALPHGASPNRSAKPRVAQYVRMMPSRWETHSVWI